MGDDVIFVAAGSAGAMLGLWRVVGNRLGTRGTVGLIGLGLSATIGALVLGGLSNVGDPGGFFDHRADLGATVLLFIVMVLPLWGLFDEAVLARVGEVGVASMGFAVAYRVAPDIGESSAITIAALSVVFVPLLRGPKGDGGHRLLAYGWFLAGAVVLAAVELGDAVEPLTTDSNSDLGVGTTFVSFAALVWLAFHGLFAAKYLLIVFTCHRRRGRTLAVDFAHRVIVSGSSSLAGMALVLGIEAILLITDHSVDWASDTVITAVVVLLMPNLDRIGSSSSDEPVPELAGPPVMP